MKCANNKMFSRTSFPSGMEEKFIIVDENLNRVENEDLNKEYNHTIATNILKEHKASNPQDIFQVISLFELEGGML
ncbi:unnamed protein product [marine sediment metagenome]|uniref:Uncharacterized protein n=1 Tax=marine sediment metagenome TaxID=412755 RepID=X1AB69_9ZZZZ